MSIEDDFADACNEISKLRAENERLKEELTERNKSCTWNFDESDFAYESDCGHYWQFIDGGPSENQVKFCQGCGRKVMQRYCDEGVE